MKLFTLLIVTVFMVSIPVFSSGKSDSSMDKMDNGKMESSGSMEKEMSGSFPAFKDMEEAMMLAESKPTVLFFNADWCPNCKAARDDFEANKNKLNGVNLVYVDYDHSEDLQMKYNVTYQHTFVQISPDGSVLAKWNGGGTEELLDMIVKSEM